MKGQFHAGEGNKDQGAGSRITIYETGPDSLTWHKIWDHELTAITNVSGPIALSISTASAGAFLSLFGSAMKAAEAAQAGQPVPVDGISAIAICAITGTLTVSVGWIAIKGQIDARRVLKEIRERNIQEL